MPSYKAKGIVLKRSNLGEADRIITVFSEEFGKIKFVAKGVRRTKSKLAGSIESFCLSQLLLSTGKSLDILASAQIENNYLGLKPSLDELKTAGLFAEIIDKIIPEKMPSETIFRLLDEAFSGIKTTDLSVAKAYFEAKFLNSSGLFPETSLCIKCEQKPKDSLYFSVQGGGIVCQDCKNYFPDSQKVKVNVIKAIRFTATNDLATFSKLSLSKEEKNELENLLGEFTVHSLGRQFKSERI